MYIVLGATGHVGSACVRALIDQSQPVLGVVHDRAGARRVQDLGADAAVVDIGDPDALRAVLREGRRAFLLNPPAAPEVDTDVAERRTVQSILSALDGSGLEKVVAQSTMGAQPGERIGDLSVLWELEQGLRAQPIPAAINRAAYYFSNFDAQLADVRRTGQFRTLFPADFILPMVAPDDLGRLAARRLMSGLDDVGVVNIEGPLRHSFKTVAQILAAVLHREVELISAPKEAWVDVFRDLGFSPPAAKAYARMTAAALDDPVPPKRETEQGLITLEAYLRSAVAVP